MSVLWTYTLQDRPAVIQIHDVTSNSTPYETQVKQIPNADLSYPNTKILTNIQTDWMFVAALLVMALTSAKKSSSWMPLE